MTLGRLTDKGLATARLLVLGEYADLPDGGVRYDFPDHLFDGGDAKGWRGRLWCWWIGRRVWLQRKLHGKEYQHPARYALN